jgi:hypothetical protein
VTTRASGSIGFSTKAKAPALDLVPLRQQPSGTL